MLGADWFAHLEAECAEAPQKWATTQLKNQLCQYINSLTTLYLLIVLALCYSTSSASVAADILLRFVLTAVALRVHILVNWSHRRGHCVGRRRWRPYWEEPCEPCLASKYCELWGRKAAFSNCCDFKFINGFLTVPLSLFSCFCGWEHKMLPVTLRLLKKEQKQDLLKVKNALFYVSSCSLLPCWSSCNQKRKKAFVVLLCSNNRLHLLFSFLFFLQCKPSLLYCATLTLTKPAALPSSSPVQI